MAREVWRDGRLYDEPDEGYGLRHVAPSVRVTMAQENRRLKRMFADLSMQADLLREALGKK
jgi:putative transposase